MYDIKDNNFFQISLYRVVGCFCKLSVFNCYFEGHFKIIIVFMNWSDLLIKFDIHWVIYFNKWFFGYWLIRNFITAVTVTRTAMRTIALKQYAIWLILYKLYSRTPTSGPKSASLVKRLETYGMSHTSHGQFWCSFSKSSTHCILQSIVSQSKIQLVSIGHIPLVQRCQSSCKLAS